MAPSLTVVTGISLATGAVCWWTGARTAADVVWVVGTLCGLVPALVWVADAVRRGRTGVDLIAVLALAGSLAVGEYLAGALIALMLATGRWLESAAERRAAHDLRALVEGAPRSARRRSPTGVVTVPLRQVVPDDVLVVGSGEAVPVDGRVIGPTAVLDESALTGEPQLVERPEGERVRSGSVNGGDVFEMRATATEADSAYAEIVRLARQAGASGAPVVRLADRYAAWFVPVSLAICGVAWALSGDPVRAVAVLVVATPCPLLLAAPVAIVSGLARAARRGVVVRDGGALERLGNARTVVLDKTGTLTTGRPRVREVAVAAVSVERWEGGDEPPEWARSAENRAVLDSAVMAWVCVDVHCPPRDHGRPHHGKDRLGPVTRSCPRTAEATPERPPAHSPVPGTQRIGCVGGM